MRLVRLAVWPTAAAVAACTLATTPAGAAQPRQAPTGPPPPPKAANGHAVRTLAHGIPTPTSIAVAGRTVFVGAAGSEDGKTPGGVFAVKGGQATLVPGSKGSVMGVTWHKGALYVSAGSTITAFNGWNGKAFDRHGVIYTGPKRFSGFNGMAFGPDGRLYAGVALFPANDHSKSNRPFAQSVISMTADGQDVKTVATGLRQPYQLAFVKGIRNPFVTVLAQDAPKNVNPPDYIVEAKPGQDYGFPACTHMPAAPCKGFARPFAMLAPHSSPMGISAIGKTLYVSLFGGIGKSGPEVVAVPTTAPKKAPQPVLTGFVAPIVGLTAHKRTIYVGDLTGSIYAVEV
jgi:glucose/arabinose dehydrogenase